MSRTTVGYIRLPKLKSFLTSCRTAKARCKTLLFKTKPRRRDEEKRFAKGQGLASQKETPAPAAGPEPATPRTK